MKQNENNDCIVQMRVMVVFGTRPEAIKLAPLVTELRGRAGVGVTVCSTGQHREMVKQVIDIFGIEVDRDLHVMTENQTLAGLTSRLFAQLDEVVVAEQPDWIVVQGDTTTAMVGAMVGFYRRIRVAHVEAGLRTGDMQHPFPEELNRRLVDLVSDVFFVPTESTRENLLQEKVLDSRIVVTGNTGIDALLCAVAKPYDWSAGPIAFLRRDLPIVLVTAHRRESFGSPFHSICEAIRQLALQFSAVSFVYPVHLNPNVRSVVKDLLADIENVHLLPPVDYLTMAKLLQNATLILTDSGGIQEEAPSFGCPILVMRETTERPEAVEAGFARIVGTDTERIISEASAVLRKPYHVTRICKPNPFGDGTASIRIADELWSRTVLTR